MTTPKPSRLWEPTHLPTPSLGAIRSRLPGLLLVLIFALAVSLRLVGLNWDDSSHIHPDERFLTMVETSLQPPSSLGEYFDTNASTFNPHNVGHGFFVYGTLPIFLVRYVAEWVGKTGYDEVNLVGRVISTIFDLVSIYLVFLIGDRLYRRRVAFLAALFTALSVLLIQHAHFFVVDPVANAFILAGLYFAIKILNEGSWIDYLLFGLMLGMSVASKINAAPLAGLAALAGFVRIYKTESTGIGREIIRTAGYLILAAVVSLLVFRVFQPYAFEGPSILDVGLNPRWQANMAEIQAMNRGDTDAPYALQWASRPPVLFSLKNLVLWGLGLPLGLVAWASWAWALWESLRGRWQRHLLLVVWTGAYFIWQSIGFTPAMRYQLPVYPTLTLLAAWGLWEAWDRAGMVRKEQRKIAKLAVGVVASVTILWTFIWALAFSSIYTRPVTRVAGTRWIYTHIPAAVNVVVEATDERLLEPIALTLDITLASSRPYDIPFKSNSEGLLVGLILSSVRDLSPEVATKNITIEVVEDEVAGAILGFQEYQATLSSSEESTIEIRFDEPIGIGAGEAYMLRLGMESPGGLRLDRQLSVLLHVGGAEERRNIELPQREFALSSPEPAILHYTSHVSGSIEAIYMPFVADVPSPTGSHRALQVELLRDPVETVPLATATFRGSLPAGVETELEILFDQPIEIEKEQRYFLRMTLVDGSALAMRATAVISETTWDDGLPLRIEGYDIGGRYRSLNQELYWHDDQDDDLNGVSDKLERIVSTLSEGDYLIITSNRQYGTITRVPARYPLTIAYYRALLGCREPKSVLECAARAQAGEVEGDLGYDLVEVFESNPTLGPIEIRDQLAEEAFTVYDHPKVLIFKKNESFSPNEVFKLLDRVDLSRVQHLLPKDVGTAEIPQDLLLPEDRWEVQQDEGTWSELFNRDGLVNRSDFVAIVAWWVLIGLIGVLAFPITRLAFSGLHDGGYPAARIVGLLIVAWGSWILGSSGVPITAVTIALVILTTALVSFALVWNKREDFLEFLRSHRREILITEAIALGFFIFDLIIRFANPDLWHPSFGGEKPMDFSYLNAVLKSTTFPPYDPWFAGGYINYYYFGFVIVGMPIKLLGLLPSMAYNLVIPTMFATLALAAYTVAYNLVVRIRENDTRFSIPNPRVAGIAAAFAVVLLGNLGTARMFYDGFKTIGASSSEEAQGILGSAQALRGVARYITLNDQMPYPLHQWYWNPSRVITPGPGEAGPITEFPFFTFLYADLHAHMINRPLTVLAIGWGLSWLLESERRGKRRWSSVVVGLFVGGLIFGALRPTNTWDFPVYWALGVIAVVYGAWLRDRTLKQEAVEKTERKSKRVSSVVEGGLIVGSMVYRKLLHNLYLGWTLIRKLGLGVVIEIVVSVGIFLGLAHFLYQPYHQWYGTGYVEAKIWEGSRTPLIDYLTVHGLFLFVTVSWMVWETIQWMATTPLSALRRLRPYALGLAAASLVYVAVTALLVGKGFQVALIVFPLIAWSGVLLLRPGLAVQKMVVLSLVGIGVALTFVVEVVVLVGDISRMNTVFKFYLQVWELFSVAAAASLAWLLSTTSFWNKGWRRVWLLILGVLVFSAALYPLTAAPAKMSDRMASEAPRKLDGIAFMPYAERFELHDTLSLAEDYEAIRWMQDNVQGTPVIVEANIPEYRWGSRYTIYTGLPGVLGWPNHQRQQRVAGPPGVVEERLSEIMSFYLTQSADEAKDFLDHYNVQYVVLGQVERAYYEKVQPCNRTGDGDAITCDLRGYPFGMSQPNVLASDCEPIDAQAEDGRLACPTHGLEKFEIMRSSGMLNEAYRTGDTVIYEVVR